MLVVNLCDATDETGHNTQHLRIEMNHQSVKVFILNLAPDCDAFSRTSTCADITRQLYTTRVGATDSTCTCRTEIVDKYCSTNIFSY